MHRGARVRQYSRTETLSLLQIREVLEGLAASLAASNRSKTQLAKLKEVHKKGGAALDSRHFDTFLALNEQLHDIIFEMSGNANIRLHVAQTQLAYFRLLTRLFDLADLTKSQTEHDALVRAIDASGMSRSQISSITRVHHQTNNCCLAIK